MKVCVVILLAALVTCAYSATTCARGCATDNGKAHAFCTNQVSCGSCPGHINCNHNKDECECHGHNKTVAPTIGIDTDA